MFRTMFKSATGLVAGMGCVFFVLISLASFAQGQDVLTFEQEVKHSFVKSLPAVVRVCDYNERTGDKRPMASGVVVSEEGLVLTVGHVNVPGKIFYVQFPDGREARARGLGEITPFDAAMIQIEEGGKYPYVPLGRSGNLPHGQACISLGYAASFRHSQPTLRLGFVVKQSTPQQATGWRGEGRRGNMRLQTTCLMEPGDSGGAVFDLEGMLIGLCSSIQLPLDANLEVPIDVYIEYWDALKQEEAYTRVPDSLRKAIPEAGAIKLVQSPIQYSDTSRVMQAAFDAQQKKAVLINSIQGDSLIEARGTLVNLGQNRLPGKKTYVLSKSSIVGDMPEVWISQEEKVVASVLHREELRDLVLLGMENYIAEGIDLSASGVSVSPSMIGTFVCSPLTGGKNKISVVGSTPFSISGQSKAGFLGAGVQLRDSGVVISMIANGSPAAAAGLTTDMYIHKINDQAVESPGKFTQLVQRHKPGDKIQLEMAHNDQTFYKEVVLATRPMASSNHVAERFEGGKSIIRDGFERVFAHDSRLHPEECGGPLLDLNGNFLGVNIARISRTGCLAIPVEEIWDFLRNSPLGIN